MTWSRLSPLDDHSLRVEYSVDSDGDESIALVGTSRGKKVTLVRELNDEGDIVRLARYIEEKSGWPVQIPSELR